MGGIILISLKEERCGVVDWIKLAQYRVSINIEK
jgi:hypothetical protein